MKSATALALLALIVCSSAAPAVAQSWKKYPYTTGLLSFPRDEGNHPPAPTEWWYWIAHVRGTNSGRRYSIIVAYPKPFAQFSRIVDVDRGLTWGGIDVGYMTTATGRLDIDFLASATKASTFNQKSGAAFEYEVTYVREGVSLSGSLVAQKPPHALGGSGFVQQLPGTSTWYYAQTRLAFSGSIATPGGGVEPAVGIAWIDRQWYDAWMSDGEYWGHWWYSIQLDDGREIEAYKTWGDGGGAPFPLFDLVGDNGAFQHLTLFDTDASAPWTDPQSGFTYPLHTRIVQPEVGADLTLTATIPEQALYPGFWEGSCRVSGSMNGQPVAGWGFVEVSVVDIKLGVARNDAAGTVDLAWRGGLGPYVVERAARPDFSDATVLAPAEPGRTLQDPALADGATWFYRVRCESPGRCAP